MKHLKSYESINVSQYLVIKHQKFSPENNNICLLETNNYFALGNKIMAQIIEPMKDSTFYVDLTDISENEYQDEFGFTFVVLYQSYNYDEAKKMFDIYSNQNKYNL